MLWSDYDPDYEEAYEKFFKISVILCSIMATGVIGTIIYCFIDFIIS